MTTLFLILTTHGVHSDQRTNPVKVVTTEAKAKWICETENARVHDIETRLDVYDALLRDWVENNPSPEYPTGRWYRDDPDQDLDDPKVREYAMWDTRFQGEQQRLARIVFGQDDPPRTDDERWYYRPVELDEES
jgi:hypothetical protein